jgi:hypothetical protein
MNMEQQSWTNRWWEASVWLLAVNSVVFGFLFGNSDNFTWAIAVGFVPGFLLLFGLSVRNSRRFLATISITAASIAASFAFWMIYPTVLGLVVIIGGFWTGKIGPTRAETSPVT